MRKQKKYVMDVETNYSCNVYLKQLTILSSWQVFSELLVYLSTELYRNKFAVFWSNMMRASTDALTNFIKTLQNSVVWLKKLDQLEDYRGDPDASCWVAILWFLVTSKLILMTFSEFRFSMKREKIRVFWILIKLGVNFFNIYLKTVTIIVICND